MRPADAAAGGAGASPPLPAPAPMPGLARDLAPGLILRLLRVDARRPASWLAWACALACGVGAAAAVPAVPVVVAAGGLLAVAALGHPPARGRGAGDRLWGGRSKLVVPGMRAAWPAVGFLLAAAGLAACGHSAAAATAAVGGAGSAGAAAAVSAICLRSRCTATLAASRALIGAGAAAAAAVAVQCAGMGPFGQGVAAVAAWVVFMACAAGGRAAAPAVGLGISANPGRQRQPEAGAGAAMVSALAAMVGCYFLAPQFAWAYAVLAVGWFAAIAVPAATEPGGPPAAVRLGHSAAGRPAFPGSLRRAARVIAGIAGLLSWPAIVALVLPAVEGSRVGGPLLALAWLGGVAGLLLLALAVAVPPGRTEDARAAVLALVALAGVGAGGGVATLPQLPGLPFPAAGQPARNGVEPPLPSCETSHSPQPARSPGEEAAFVESAALGARY